jgi:hypothetical protein
VGVGGRRGEQQAPGRAPGGPGGGVGAALGQLGRAGDGQGRYPPLAEGGDLVVAASAGGGGDPLDGHGLGQAVGQRTVGTGGDDNSGRAREPPAGQVIAEHRSGLGGAHLAGYDVRPGGVDVGGHEPWEPGWRGHGEAADQGVDPGQGNLAGRLVVGRHDDDVDVAPGDAAGLVGGVGHRLYGSEHLVGLGCQRAAGREGHAEA